MIDHEMLSKLSLQGSTLLTAFQLINDNRRGPSREGPVDAPFVAILTQLTTGALGDAVHPKKHPQDLCDAVAALCESARGVESPAWLYFRGSAASAIVIAFLFEKASLAQKKVALLTKQNSVCPWSDWPESLHGLSMLVAFSKRFSLHATQSRTASKALQDANLAIARTVELLGQPHPIDPQSMEELGNSGTVLLTNAALFEAYIATGKRRRFVC